MEHILHLELINDFINDYSAHYSYELFFRIKLVDCFTKNLTIKQTYGFLNAKILI